MIILNNTTTTNNYPSFGLGGAYLGGPQGIYRTGYFLVANAAVFAQFGYGPQGLQPTSPEIFLPPAAYPISEGIGNPIAGIRFRSAVAGLPAQVFGVLFAPHDPTMTIGAEITSTVSASGVITPSGGVVTTTFSPITGTDDGYVAALGPAYPPAFGTAQTSGPSSIPGKSFNNPNFDVRNMLVRFDTSTIPDTAIVQAASLNLYIIGTQNQEARNLVGEWYAGSNWPIVAADGAITPAATAFTIAIGSLTAGSINALSLTSASNVNLSGYTGFRIGVDGGQPALFNTVSIPELEHPTLPEPKLSVTYLLA